MPNSKCGGSNGFQPEIPEIRDFHGIFTRVTGEKISPRLTLETVAILCPLDANRQRSRNSQSNPAGSHVEYREHDVGPDVDGFTQFPRQDQHGFLRRRESGIVVTDASFVTRASESLMKTRRIRHVVRPLRGRMEYRVVRLPARKQCSSPLAVRGGST